MFQPTPPRGRRPHCYCTTPCCMLVSTHASAREATRAIDRLQDHDHVSTHASAREATCGEGGDVLQFHMFQPTPPRGRRLGRANDDLEPESFNPRLRAGGDSWGAEALSHKGFKLLLREPATPRCLPAHYRGPSSREGPDRV